MSWRVRLGVNAPDQRCPTVLHRERNQRDHRPPKYGAAAGRCQRRCPLDTPPIGVCQFSHRRSAALTSKQAAADKGNIFSQSHLAAARRACWLNPRSIECVTAGAQRSSVRPARLARLVTPPPAVAAATAEPARPPPPVITECASAGESQSALPKSGFVAALVAPIAPRPAVAAAPPKPAPVTEAAAPIVPRSVVISAQPKTGFVMPWLSRPLHQLKPAFIPASGPC